MNENYETPVVEIVGIEVQDIMTESNELPELDLYS